MILIFNELGLKWEISGDGRLAPCSGIILFFSKSPATISSDLFDGLSLQILFDYDMNILLPYTVVKMSVSQPYLFLGLAKRMFLVFLFRRLLWSVDSYSSISCSRFGLYCPALALDYWLSAYLMQLTERTHSQNLLNLIVPKGEHVCCLSVLFWSIG